MENKYYTPKIEEFYVGFEYYWKSEIYSQEFFGKLETLEDLENQILADKIRVKYLDTEDIESLGFRQVNNNFPIGFEINFYHINFRPNTEMPNLSIYDKRDRVSLFQGIVKNKSELKKLMQQLNIK